ncbi:winged helix-turn-helix transcriptional regulator [Arthrobacter sp. TES]|jgi:DNA-binding winged helix-turn-helix (wHTH) protein|uniref:Winged helix-turn-helix domain-containing protein n=1 Tax=Paenarthrobacter ureafaciens TaxID=37931 RepID=A0AAX3EJT2_PAEUR|nr:MULTISPECIES: winged helix-turn-helix domain-containing protein [Paenarthrobacter]AMB39387.1 transcriptional regulator [Arthrobacter sp. ATCC 21022]AOY72711.1 histidine kinase [Arthrobacter sp. ZXY-2]ERI35490.1 histidine kinase [Arthrobacter sp. AK-YN10]NKR12427.1 transcriptional regulator [Arthrobacter sp. M5]NKR14258.1 transcriptional regulator [Arthrobacter sp. M6]OEH61300.1 transcriptional regulator [Arthrobacter sp. D2]OEH64270.1 transcriptional regulator [Arthrobacter sp. D4]QOI643
MSVASGYVHISVRNANKAASNAGLRPGFGNRPGYAPGTQAAAQQAPGYVPQGYNPNSYGQLRAVPAATEPAAMTAPTPVVAQSERLRPVANDNVARGFVLYMGIDEETAAAAGTSIAKLAQEIRAYAQSLVTGAESYAAVAVAPASAPGSALDVVRSTFGDPTVAARQRTEAARPAPQQEARPSGVLIDLARREVHLDGESLNLTFKEFELLNYLVENGTRTVGRDELLEGLWRNAEEVPNERTIDVHIRRLRSKLGRLANTVRTVRGQGYRFYEHPEVIVWAAPEYSI